MPAWTQPCGCLQSLPERPAEGLTEQKETSSSALGLNATFFSFASCGSVLELGVGVNLHFPAPPVVACARVTCTLFVCFETRGLNSATSATPSSSITVATLSPNFPLGPKGA